MNFILKLTSWTDTLFLLSIKFLRELKYEESMPGLTIVVLLVISITLVTFAWYGHFRYQSASFWKAVFISRPIASLELGSS